MLISIPAPAQVSKNPPLLLPSKQEIAPAVVQETVRHEHETREQTVVDRERQ
jgi:hypothetical protein